MGLGNVIIGLLTKALVFGIFTFVHRFAIFNIGYQWWAWALIFFADDFSYYWFHRISHECRFFWASHVVHHSYHAGRESALPVLDPHRAGAQHGPAGNGDEHAIPPSRASWNERKLS